MSQRIQGWFRIWETAWMQNQPFFSNDSSWVSHLWHVWTREMEWAMSEAIDIQPSIIWMLRMWNLKYTRSSGAISSHASTNSIILLTGLGSGCTGRMWHNVGYIGERGVRHVVQLQSHQSWYIVAAISLLIANCIIAIVKNLKSQAYLHTNFWYASTYR